MKKLLVIAMLVGTALWAAKTDDRIARETGHELRGLAYYGVFDWIQYQVEGNDVRLLGSVTRTTLKSDAEKVIRSIEGVGKVSNEIEVLPLSEIDDQIRLNIYHGIYGNPALSRYGLNATLPIHIVVKNGDVELDGAVSTEFDRNLAYSQANTVGGVHSVKNNLMVTKD